MSAVVFDANALIDICRENDAARLEVFGSTARDEANEDSDVDLLVEFSRRTVCSLWYRWSEK
jgi:predicted nucleotidyltransferase